MLENQRMYCSNFPSKDNSDDVIGYEVRIAYPNELKTLSRAWMSYAEYEFPAEEYEEAKSCFENLSLPKTQYKKTIYAILRVKVGGEYETEHHTLDVKEGGNG